MGNEALIERIGGDISSLDDGSYTARCGVYVLDGLRNATSDVPFTQIVKDAVTAAAADPKNRFCERTQSLLIERFGEYDPSLQGAVGVAN
ncbi:hypothetical protein HN935_03100 [archaeon]|jgi:hypothetical protein|nr:hypothetical protein [archaeon]